MRRKTCKHCKAKFLPTRPLQSCCGIDCAIEFGRQQKALGERKEDAKKKKELRSNSHHCADVQKVFNAAVRERDRFLPCISCGRPASWGGQWHASHLKSVGANSALRFNFKNVSKSCSVCNNHLSGNIDGYRRGIIARYGQDVLDSLDCADRSRRFSTEYLERLECLLKKMTKRWRRLAESRAAYGL